MTQKKASEKPRIQKYLDRYSLGILDRSNSLELYDSFLKNQGENRGLKPIVQGLLRKKPMIRIFEIGCGTGGALLELKRLFRERVIVMGNDLLPCEEPELDESLSGDALEIDFPQECDLVFSFRAMHEIGHTGEIVEKVCECLSSQGLALLSIRIAASENGQKIFLGEMTSEDEQFLTELPNKLQTCRVEKRFFSDPTDSHVLAGVFIRIEKKKTPIERIDRQ